MTQGGAIAGVVMAATAAAATALTFWNRFDEVSFGCNGRTKICLANTYINLKLLIVCNGRIKWEATALVCLFHFSVPEGHS
jgi:hypothetical protein